MHIPAAEEDTADTDNYCIPAAVAAADDPADCTEVGDTYPAADTEYCS